MKNYLKYSLALAVVSGIMVGGITFASLGGFWKVADPAEFAEKHSEMFSEQAEMFGVTTEQMKQYWAEGKTMSEIAEVVGLSQEDLQAEMQARRQERMQEQMQILVESGVITQEQANQRTEAMQDRGGRMFGLGGGRKGFGGMGRIGCNK